MPQLGSEGWLGPSPLPGRFCGCWSEEKIKMCFQDRGVSSANQEHCPGPGGAQRGTLL